MPELPLANKTIVIIGGTTGLGLSAAKACVAAGASVAVMGRNVQSVTAAKQQLGEHAIAIQGDATDSGAPEAAIQQAVETFGRFDGLYHVAGGSGRKAGDGPLHEMTDQGWQYTLDLNLTSIMQSNRAAVKFWKDQEEREHAHDSNSIVNMGSVLGWAPSPKYFSTHAYATTKAAIIGLTRSCAAYYAADNIRFNVIAPALVATPMSARAQNDDVIQQFVKTKQPLDGGRIGAPEDCDAAAVFLLSDQSRFVTGQTIAVDGGWSVSEGQYSK